MSQQLTATATATRASKAVITRAITKPHLDTHTSSGVEFCSAGGFVEDSIREKNK